MQRHRTGNMAGTAKISFERALTVGQSRIFLNFLGPAGVVSAPMPMDERSFVVADKDAERTAVLRTPFSAVDVEDGTDLGVDCGNLSL